MSDSPVTLRGLAGLVTGGASGIGRATVLALARAGAAVVIADLERQRGTAEEVVRLVEADGGSALFVPTDVTTEDAHEDAVATTVAQFGALDFAVNNAGVDHRARFEHTSQDDFERVLSVNVTGVFLGIKHQLLQMRRQGGGSIVNTASVAGVTAVPMLGAYVASKHAVVGLTKAAALEAGSSDVRVNCILPTFTRTPMSDGVDQSIIDRLISPHAIKRIAEPDEMANAILFLASPASSGITGAVLPVDLGSTAGLMSTAVAGEF